MTLFASAIGTGGQSIEVFLDEVGAVERCVTGNISVGPNEQEPASLGSVAAMCIKLGIRHYVRAMAFGARGDGDRSYHAVPSHEACGRLVSHVRAVPVAAQDQQRVVARAEKIERTNGLPLPLEPAHVRKPLAGRDRL